MKPQREGGGNNVYGDDITEVRYFSYREYIKINAPPSILIITKYHPDRKRNRK